MSQLSERLAIAASIVGEIDEKGFCRCPGRELHTNKIAGGKIGRECRLYLEPSTLNPRGVPSLRCQHTSCADIVSEAQRKLRSEIGKHEKKAGPLPIKTKSQTDAELAAKRRREELDRLGEEQAKLLRPILERYKMNAMELTSEVPAEPLEQGRALLSLFAASDVVWCGIHGQSITTEEALDGAHSARLARIRAARPFRTAAEWRSLGEAPGPRICPSSFKPGQLSRSNQYIARKRFMVIEHDKVSLDEQAALLTWLQWEEGLKLRAVIFTGGKSLHGWFDYPGRDAEALKAKLCGSNGKGGMQFDPASFNPSQAYRVPGWKHEKTGRTVELWFIHP